MALEIAERAASGSGWAWFGFGILFLFIIIAWIIISKAASREGLPVGIGIK